MIIVHIAPNAVYDDYWGFHENLLPKYHKRMGNEVTLIVNTMIHTKEGKGETQESDYLLNDGVRVIRRKIKRYFFTPLTALFSKLDILDYLQEISPDFIYFHGLCSKTMNDCIKFKKLAATSGKSCIIVQDNHLDYNIGNAATTIKQKLARLYYRLYNKRTQKFVEKVYGVTPWRQQYAEEYYHISSDKTDLLIMGADDECVDFEHRDSIREHIRSKYNVTKKNFFIVTGGKIDNKKNIIELMKACSGLNNVTLLVFGKVSKDLKAKFESIIKSSNNIIYIGWIDSKKVYDYFFAADLVFFPGQHSVLWEQACASKVPCVFQRWIGMEHVNNGGNSYFLDDISVKSIRNTIKKLQFTDEYYLMKKIANSSATDIYMYSTIAKKALECASTI